MSTRFNRPADQFNGQPDLTYRFKYQQDETVQRVIDPIKVDGDVNYVVDALNTLDDDLNGVVAGSIPGASDPGNAGKVVTTDGAGNISFTAITSTNIGQYSIDIDRLQNGTTGEMITWNADNNPTTVAVGESGAILTSSGPGATPRFVLTPILNKNGDTMNGRFGLYSTFTGENYYDNGTGDGASYGTHNLRMVGKAGIGYYDNVGNVNAYYDFTQGKWDVKNGYFINGTNVLDAAQTQILPVALAQANAAQTDRKVSTYVYFTVASGVITIHRSLNVSSVTANGTGFSINFTSAYADNRYTVAASGAPSSVGASTTYMVGVAGSQGASTVKIQGHTLPAMSTFTDGVYNVVIFY